ncbi:MAG: NAD-dependent epimerase/dehydratase family protein, partial [Propionibacteriaceae bacterium]|nr:NAD-dependent epimerase/dehydratase family protein [Propionibacteriaceae bacterium]
MSDLIRQDGQTIAQSWTGDLLELDDAVIAVSGASGLIGRHIVSLLLALSEMYGTKTTVIALGRRLDTLQSVFTPWLPDQRFQLRQANPSEGESWPPEATHLIQAASPATPGVFATDPVGVIRANVLGMLSALDCAAANGSYLSFIS